MQKLDYNVKALTFMYWYTLIGAGGFGLGLIVVPDFIKFLLLGWPVQEPLALGIIASSFLAFGILSFLGLRAPTIFAPILLLQLLYKVIWFMAVFIPVAVQGDLELYGMVIALIFATYVVGDIVALPIKAMFRQRD